MKTLDFLVGLWYTEHNKRLMLTAVSAEAAKRRESVRTDELVIINY